MMHVGDSDRAAPDESTLAMESSELVLPRRFLLDKEEAAGASLSSMMLVARSVVPVDGRVLRLLGMLMLDVRNLGGLTIVGAHGLVL